MNGSTRVLVVTDFSDKPEINLYKGLAAAGCRVEVLCDPASKEASELVPAGIPTTPLQVRHRLDFKAVATIRKIINERQIDIVYACRNSSLSATLFARGKHPASVVAYRGTTGHLNWFDPGSLLTYLNPRVDKIVCVSDAVRKYLRSMLLPEKRLVTIYKGHDVSWYRAADRTALDAFGIPRDAFVAGFAANMRRVKGADILMKAVMDLNDGARVHLLMVGQVRDARVSGLAARYASSGKIHMAGYRSDASSLMGACDVFVMPSLKREGLPRAIIEAMAQGVPCVASGVGGIPELLEDGVCGLLVPPGDPVRLGQALLAMQSDSARRYGMGQLARKRIEKHFNIRDTITRTLALYDELLNRS